MKLTSRRQQKKPNKSWKFQPKSLGRIKADVSIFVAKSFLDAKENNKRELEKFQVPRLNPTKGGNQPLLFGWSYERWRVAAIPGAPETLAWKGSASTGSVASIHHWICHVATIPTCTIWRAGGETAVGKTWSGFLLAFVRSYSPFQENVHIPSTMLASLAFTKLSSLLRRRLKSTMLW